MDRLHVATGTVEQVGTYIVLLDLDGFKLVNDALGHQVGDDLLCSTADRIKRALPEASIARIGGDEFAVLIAADPGTSPDEIGLSLVQRVGLPTKIAGTEVTVPTSVGVAAVVPGVSALELMHRADVALYRAKGAGKNCYCVFDSGVSRDVQRQLSISQSLRRAIDDDELELHYQPVVDLDTEVVVAYEALARWTPPSVGKVSPSEFIGLAERTGLIVQLGRTLLDKALRRLAIEDGRTRTNIHVNMSRRELHQPDLVRVVRQLLEESGLEPRRLVLEVTETSVAVDPKRMVATLHELSELGVRLALDDFGAGATSLSNLWHFPLDIVKLDLSLIAPLRAPGLIGRTAENRVHAIIDLCHAHDLVVTSEGVEHIEQVDVLRHLGCDYAQGWYFGRPQPTMAEGQDAIGRSASSLRSSSAASFATRTSM
jgi:diguanylate cyclase (GGDEF)-like protein